VEPGFATPVLDEIFANFPEYHLWEEKNLFFGGVHTLATHPKLGFSGSGDPRRYGVCRMI
jgi:gamma-glutamyltranspeptidase/glutathione hydrolase